MIEQIRHLQAAKPFEPFALELSSGRIVQIYEPFSVATRDSYGRSPAASSGALIGVLHASGAFEVLATSQIVSLSVGEHPSIKAKRDRQMEHYRKIIGEPEGGAS
ncbi:MAG: hypothetical protein JO151_16135 [Verrucomicrobia bacterium]|nr:hypothetical protein [Verrucomicrobiota bacterium]